MRSCNIHGVLCNKASIDGSCAASICDNKEVIKKYQNIYNDLNTQTSASTAKADSGKLEISLVPPQIIRDIAEVRMYGNKKYHDPNNWKQVSLERYINALLRHTLKFWEDPYMLDDESGLPHYKHMACNMAFICDMIERGKKNEKE